MCKLEVQENDGVTVVRLVGSLSSTDVIEVEPQFRAVAMDKVRRVVVDMAGVEILATPAITMFISAMTYQRRNGGRLIFTGTEGAIDKLLHVCRLDTIMTIVHDPTAAIAQAGR